MAAPAATARGTPAGLRLTDGFSSKYTFKRFTTVSLWEMEAAPPGLDGGEPVATTTMFNTLWRTMKPRKLITLSPTSFKCAFDPNCFTQLDDMININDEITQTFSDGSTLAFWGYLQKIDFDPMVEGQMPTATVTIVPTNTDNSGAEQAPVVSSVSGT